MLGPSSCGPGKAPGDCRGTCGVSLGTSARCRLGPGTVITAAWAEAASVGCRDRRPGARHRPEGHSLPLGPVVPVREEARGHASARGARPSRSRRGAAGSQPAEIRAAEIRAAECWVAESRAAECWAARGSAGERLGRSGARAAWDRGSLAGKGGAGWLHAWRRNWPKHRAEPATPEGEGTRRLAAGPRQGRRTHARVAAHFSRLNRRAGAWGVTGAVAMAGQPPRAAASIPVSRRAAALRPYLALGRGFAGRACGCDCS